MPQMRPGLHPPPQLIAKRVHFDLGQLQCAGALIRGHCAPHSYIRFGHAPDDSTSVQDRYSSLRCSEAGLNFIQ
jgi:hypothetical protein